MKPSEIVYLAIGTFIGIGVVFYRVDMPKADKCQTYTVATKSVTSYALKPPPPVVIPANCPVAPKCEKENIIEQEQETEKVEEKKLTRRHRHWRHRVRRYWR